MKGEDMAKKKVAEPVTKTRRKRRTKEEMAEVRAETQDATYTTNETNVEPKKRRGRQAAPEVPHADLKLARRAVNSFNGDYEQAMAAIKALKDLT